MNSIALGLYEKSMPNHMSIEEKLLLAKKAGYDYLELSVDETSEKLSRLDMPIEEVYNWRRLTEKIGVPIWSMCLSGHRKYPLGSMDVSVRQQSVEILKKAVIFSDRLGIKIIQLAGYDVYYEKSSKETEEFFFENLKECVNFAARYGIILAFETRETPFMNTVEKAMAVVEKIKSPYLQVYPDVGNVANGAENPILDLQRGEGHIVAAHLKETNPGVFRDMQFGDGQVDFDACIQELKRQKIGLCVTEFWYDGTSEPLSYVMRSRKFFEGKI